jgi:hypothetical protein
MLNHSDIFNTETFCYGDVLFRRRSVTGDVMLRRRSVTETFCREKFCRGEVSACDKKKCRSFSFLRKPIDRYRYIKPRDDSLKVTSNNAIDLPT